MGRMPPRSLLRHSWARLGNLATVLEAMLGLSWVFLGPFEGLLGPFWGFSGASLAVLWRSWRV